MTDNIILVDAFAQIYRGFFAIPVLNNSQGQPTNAILALMKFLLKIHQELPGSAGAFVFDCGKPAFRLELAPDYKANRPPMPDELSAQLPYVERAVAAFGWPAIRCEGYEADDLIAAVAADFADRNVRIVSSDKDLHQAVNERVHMLVPGRDGSFDERGPAEVTAKFQVTPEQIVDYLSLIGDSSDNIPGVSGVGPKTAANLLGQYGSLRAMLDHPEQIANPRLRDKIIAATPVLHRNPQLIRLKTSVPEAPWHHDVSCLCRRAPDWDAIRAIATELELKSLFRDIDAATAPAATVPPAPTVAGKVPAAPAPEQPDLFG
ncbi:MAG: 5'-3' exonuclease H3TH domain-containing protein [Victivallales bacterium]|nr:5'-3' exonuclease H3TH domain-containing protein [Victivallales bacterium]